MPTLPRALPLVYPKESYQPVRDFISAYWSSASPCKHLTALSSMQVHGKKAVVNFRQSASEIQWQPRNKRGASSSAETSCISFGEMHCPLGP